MKQLIQEWLMNSLGLVLDLKKRDLGQKVKDGYFISKILCGFEVISKEELAFIQQTEDREVAMNNYLSFVLIWLGRLGIRMKDSELFELLDGNERTAINLFYELYLRLQDKTKLHMFTRKRIIEKTKPPHNKFEVTKVIESDLDDFIMEVNPHFKDLVGDRDILKWHRDQLAALKKQCAQSRKEYLLYFKTRKQETFKPFICKCDIKCICSKFEPEKNQVEYSEEASQNFTYQELMDGYKESEKVKKHEPNMEEARKVVKQLKTRRTEKEERDLKKMRLHTELCEEIWNEMVKNQEKQIEELVEEKITSQSFYEKQMINKMFRIKHQQNVIEENRKFVDKEIMKQKEEDINQKLYTDQRLSDECVCDYLYERERIKQLHRKVYAEKQRLKKARIEKICRETADDLINLAIRVGEFKDSYKEEPTRRRYDDWVSLFLKGGKILPVIVPAEDIVQDLSDLPEEEELLFLEEIERQEIIDTKDFEKYNRNEWPWELENVSDFHYDFRLIQRGLNIIGHIVHRLLKVKYPSTPLMPKPDFKFEYAVCINGLSDTTVSDKLQSLLSFKNIEVFEVLNAVNYCLDRLVEEQKQDENDEEESIDVEVIEEKKPKSASNKLAKGKKGKTSKKRVEDTDRSTVNEENLMEPPPKSNKKNQTPRIFPSEEVKRSHAATLGGIAKNSLDMGEPLTDYLLAAMIVEYLHSISDKRGWALINFPTNYNQAVTLEENLSSTPLCKDFSAVKSIMDLTELDYKNTEGFMMREKNSKQYSKLFPLPPKLKDEDTYDTVLTAYIKIVKTPAENEEGAERTLPPITRYISECSDPVEKFYAEQGCAYFMFYDTFDYNTVKDLARLVIGDFTLPRKPSIELFGKSVLLGQEEMEDESVSKAAKFLKEVPTKEKEKKKIYVQKSEEEDKKGKGEEEKKSKGKKKMHDTDVVRENKQVQVPPLEDIYEVIIEDEDPNILPGDEKWKYLEIPLPEDLLLVLARMCENMENLYLEDFKQTLFMRRLVLNNIQPYISHTQNHLLEFLHRPDDRQSILHEFQMTFNEISDCLRSDDEVKAELHCRVDELRRSLETTSDQNIMESFRERETIIEKHWLRRQLHELTQIYVCAMQLELDRFVDTIQLLTDYYVSGITNNPPEEAPFGKELIKSLDLDNVYSYESYTSWKDAFDTKYFNERIISKVSKCCEFVEKTKNTVHKIVTNTQGKFALGKPKPEKLKRKGPPPAQMPNIVRDNMDKLLEEWKTAMDAECERVIFRVRLLKSDSDHRFREMSTKMRDMMNEIYNLIRRRYNNEQSSIQHLCDVISSAIENETPIQMELFIDRDKFYAQPDVLLFPDDIPPSPPPVKEWKQDSVFTLDQLRKLYRFLLDLAPSGTIPERQFAYILQDMLVHDVEDGEEHLAPDLWRQLTTLELEKVISEIFSKSEYINWRDFIIFNIMIEMPSSEQLIDLKRQFLKIDKAKTENVSVQDFDSFTFWFEKSFCKEDESDMKRLEMAKHLIRDMYKVKENVVNYSAMLVDFCKDHNGTSGFAKLLGLIVDRPVCWEMSIGRKFVQYQIRSREAHDESVKMREQEIEEETTAAMELLGDIADETVHQCDSVVITELTQTSSNDELSLNAESCGDQCICDSRCFCGDKPEKPFSNVSIAFEESFDPALAYFLDLETVLAAEAAVLLWHNQVQNIEGKSFRQEVEKIYEECRNPDFNNDVLVHEFLNHPEFTKLLANTTRFTDKNPSNLVQNLIKFRK